MPQLTDHTRFSTSKKSDSTQSWMIRPVWSVSWPEGPFLQEQHVKWKSQTPGCVHSEKIVSRYGTSGEYSSKETCIQNSQSVHEVFQVFRIPRDRSCCYRFVAAAVRAASTKTTILLQRPVNCGCKETFHFSVFWTVGTYTGNSLILVFVKLWINKEQSYFSIQLTVDTQKTVLFWHQKNSRDRVLL